VGQEAGKTSTWVATLLRLHVSRVRSWQAGTEFLVCFFGGEEGGGGGGGGGGGVIVLSFFFCVFFCFFFFFFFFFLLVCRFFVFVEERDGGCSKTPQIAARSR